MIGKKLINTGGAAVENLPSGYFNTVTYTGNGGTQKIGGYINRGGVFNGSSSGISLGSLNQFSSNTVSFSLWFNSTSVSTTAILMGSNQNSIFAGELDLYTYNSGFLLTVATASNVYRQWTTPANLSNNTWHNVVVTLDSATSEVAKIYLDGNEQTKSILGQSGTISGALLNSAANLNLGVDNVPASYFNGKIDQFRIFNKALSSSEVTTLSNEAHASTTISTTDIFSDNSAVALYQLGGNANDTGGVSGYIGEGAIFNGSSSRTHASGLTIPSTTSISMWVKPNNNTSDSTVFSSQTSDFRREYPMLIWYPTSSTYKGFAAIYTQNGGFITSPSVASANEWHHVVCIKNSDGSGSMYVDNSLIGSVSANTTHPQSAGFTLGCLYEPEDNGFVNFFNGSIDQVRIYDKALSSSEVTTLYGETASSNITISDLVAYYPMEGTSLDQEGSYHGTDTNVEYNYSGTATNVTYQDATNFSPDLVWVKSRNHSNNHFLYDSVRGVNKAIYIQAEPEITRSGVTSFDSNGFTLGSSNDMNLNGSTFVSWCFNAGTDAAASNTDGSITSTVKANQDAGFSIVKYTGNGSTGTVGHGLSSTPELIIRKDLDAATDWWVYAPVSPYYGYLNHTDALQGANNSAYSYNQTTPTSTVFSVGNTYSGNVNSNNYIAYNFHSVDGIQKVGSYTGNGGSNMIETGFEPAFVMFKKTNNTTNSHWQILDNKRNTSNPRDKELFASTSGAEVDINRYVNFTSNGFELTSASYTNDNNDTYIYLAIAADPDTTTPTVEDSFEVVTYTGNGTDTTVNTGFKPDMVWIKERTSTSSPRIVDSVRGNKKRIFTNVTNAESEVAAGEVLLENGFQIGADNGSNQNNEDYVAWCWKAGDHDDNLPQINTEGTISSVTSVNDAAGFSIVKYTGNLTASTVGTGLSSAAELIIVKRTDSTSNWFVYSQPTGNTKYLSLDTTAAAATFNVWNNTSPTSSVFSLAAQGDVNASGGSYIAYCFTSITGYQKIGSYTGTGATGNVINVGFKPRFLLIKGATITDSWYIFDDVRNPNDPRNTVLRAESNQAEQSLSPTTWSIDFESDGFSFNSGVFNNPSETYIYLAIK